MAKVLVSPLSWGMGHATRVMPIIKELLLHGHEVGVAATGIALEVLAKDFPGLKYYDVIDYCSPYTCDGFSLKKLFRTLPQIYRDINREHEVVNKIIEQDKYDLVISDNRFGVYSERKPSLFITHQLRFSMPGRINLIEFLSEYFNKYCHKNFDKILVPDNSPEDGALAGKLSFAKKYYIGKNIYYIGIVSSVKKLKVEENLDYLISISGPKEQKASLQKIILEQVTKLPGRKVVLLGDPSVKKEYKMDFRTLVKPFANRKEMSKLMNRAKFVVTRSGYTTVMEIAELEKKKVLFIPTPGQTEQEYLSGYYEEKRWFHSVNQEDLCLIRDVEVARGFKGLPKMTKSVQNIKKLYKEVIENYLA